MHRNGQDVRIVIENRLGSVAVVHVPVDHRDAQVGARAARGADGDGDIGEEAEPHRVVGQAVMSRRSGQRIGVLVLAVQYAFNRRDCEASRLLADFIGAGTEGRTQAHLAAVRVGQRFEIGQVGLRVDEA